MMRHAGHPRPEQVSRWIARGALAAVLVVPHVASARSTSRWADARDGVLRATETRALDAADLQLGEGARLRRLASGFDPLGSTGLLAHQQEARRILEAAGGARAASPEVRLRYAEVLSNLGQWAEAAAVLEGVVDHLPAARRIDAWVELAVAYARVGRGLDEIQCYERALAFEPHGRSRSTILANQAEAYMAVGDVARAILGYRAALEPLSSPEEVAARAPTTLWGLGVALDRYGELDAALDAIQRARSYDPADRSLSGEGWFFNPAHDAAWYGGLGHLLVARRGPELDVRRAAYGRAIDAFREYVAMAPEGDLWLPAARARIVALTAEQLRFERRFAAEMKKDAKPAKVTPRRPAR